MTEDYLRRFGGIARLYGTEGLERLSRAKVAVIGLGGVGSWAVESLARSGIGALRLVDMDDLCITNVNRQLPALTETVGRSKAHVLKDRIAAIAPECEVETQESFYTPNSCAEVLGGDLDYVLDAIDTRKNKAHLLSSCRDYEIPVVTCGGAGGRRDPTCLHVDDMIRCYGDALLSKVRRRMREVYGFPMGGQKKPKIFRIEAVFSDEFPAYPTCDGRVTERKDEALEGSTINCDSGFGSVTHVTGTFGFVAAGRVVHHIAAGTCTAPRPR